MKPRCLHIRALYVAKPIYRPGAGLFLLFLFPLSSSFFFILSSLPLLRLSPSLPPSPRLPLFLLVFFSLLLSVLTVFFFRPSSSFSALFFFSPPSTVTCRHTSRNSDVGCWGHDEVECVFILKPADTRPSAMCVCVARVCMCMCLCDHCSKEMFTHAFAHTHTHTSHTRPPVPGAPQLPRLRDLVQPAADCLLSSSLTSSDPGGRQITGGCRFFCFFSPLLFFG